LKKNEIEAACAKVSKWLQLNDRMSTVDDGQPTGQTVFGSGIISLACHGHRWRRETGTRAIANLLKFQQPQKIGNLLKTRQIQPACCGQIEIGCHFLFDYFWPHYYYRC